jgi:myo-inositol-1(or 4)-monophosphatase
MKFSNLSSDVEKLIDITLSIRKLFLEGYYSLNDNQDIKVKSHRADLVTKYDKLIEDELIKKINLEFPNFEIIGEESFNKSEINKPLKLNNHFIIDPIDGTMNYIHNIPLVSISIGMYKNGTLYSGIIFNPISNEFFVAEKNKGSYLNNHCIKDYFDISFYINLKKIKCSNELVENIIFFCQPSNRNDIRVMNNIDNYKLLEDYITKTALTTRSFRSSAIELAYIASGRVGGQIFHRVNIWDISAGIILIQEAGGGYIDLNGIEGKIDTIELQGGIFASKKNLTYIKENYYA